LAFLAKSTFAQSGSATSGLTYYDLELGAKFLDPVLTPLRNEIPRVSGKGGIQAAWRAVTGINTTGLRIGVSAGNRGGVQAVSTQDYTAAYKGIGIEASATGALYMTLEIAPGVEVVVQRGSVNTALPKGTLKSL
jgi:hypothetical protein